jgi:hypothetical protein
MAVIFDAFSFSRNRKSPQSQINLNFMLSSGYNTKRKLPDVFQPTKLKFYMDQDAKAVPLHAMKALGGERRYSSYSFSTSALDRGEWSASCPGHALAPGKGPPVPIVQEAGWAPELVWTQRLQNGPR